MRRGDVQACMESAAAHFRADNSADFPLILNELLPVKRGTVTHPHPRCACVGQSGDVFS